MGVRLQEFSIAHTEVVLVSGGLDSAVALALAQQRCERSPQSSERTATILAAVSFDYGQRHQAELEAAKRVVRSLNRGRTRPDIYERRGSDGWIEHLIFPLPRVAVEGSALTPTEGVGDILPLPLVPETPKNRSEAEIGAGIPATYVPARNLVMLAQACALAEARGAARVWIGVNALDYSGYPDCRGEFLEAFQTCLDVGTKRGVEGEAVQVQAPLLDKTKAQIIRLGLDLGVDLSLTRSCYDPDEEGRACGGCDACLLRAKGFREAGVQDPTPYIPDEPSVSERTV